MYVFISYLIQCLYSPMLLVSLYSVIMCILIILFHMLMKKPQLLNREHHCLPCDKLYPVGFKHCYKCHTCFPTTYRHVRMFRSCLDDKTYFIWNTNRNTLLFVFSLYNLLHGIYTKVFIDVLLIGISLL